MRLIIFEEHAESTDCEEDCEAGPAGSIDEVTATQKPVRDLYAAVKKSQVAMESECLEPLNLVIKKDGNSDGESTVIEDNPTSAAERIEEDNKEETKAQDGMAILQEAVKAGESGLQPNDQKILTALHMSNLMQMSNMTLPRGVNPPAYGTQYYFMQLLAMVEAQQLMCQQMSWSAPQHFARNPLRLPQPYFDGPATNLTEQLCNSQNSAAAYTLPAAKRDTAAHETKQSHSKR